MLVVFVSVMNMGYLQFFFQNPKKNKLAADECEIFQPHLVANGDTYNTNLSVSCERGCP